MQKTSQSSLKKKTDPFAQYGHDWWKLDGAFAPLHRLNPLRLRFIQDSLGKKLAGMDILDIGCGGGILSEPLARIGGRVVGIDLTKIAIKTALAHAKKSGLTIDYRLARAEDLVGKEKFHLVTAMEVVEHLEDVDSFLDALAGLVMPQGHLVMSTLNRTIKSFLLGIVAAEYILGLVPRGTHQWHKFIRPDDLKQALEKRGFEVLDIKGIILNPLTGGFEMHPRDVAVNYILIAKRRAR